MSGCQLGVKQKKEEKEEKHESAAAAAPGSGFNGLPQQRGTVAENWTQLPVGPGARAHRAQVGRMSVCGCDITL